MKATEVKSMLEQVVNVEVQSSINYGPFDIFAPEGHVYRLFDVAYSAGKLVVYVEAELGRKKRTSFEPALVTPADQAEYNLLVEAEISRMVDATKKEYGAAAVEQGKVLPMTAFAQGNVPHTTGVLVDSADDSQLLTARVESVVVQYKMDLAGFMQYPHQKEYIAEVSQFHCVKIDRPCVGKRGYLNIVGVSSLDDIKREIKPYGRGYWKADSGNVLVAVISKDELDSLQGTIRAVYFAGMEVERAKALMASPVFAK